MISKHNVRLNNSNTYHVIFDNSIGHSFIIHLRLPSESALAMSLCIHVCWSYSLLHQWRVIIEYHYDDWCRRFTHPSLVIIIYCRHQSFITRRSLSFANQSHPSTRVIIWLTHCWLIHHLSEWWMNDEIWCRCAINTINENELLIAISLRINVGVINIIIICMLWWSLQYACIIWSLCNICVRQLMIDNHSSFTLCVFIINF